MERLNEMFDLSLSKNLQSLPKSLVIPNIMTVYLSNKVAQPSSIPIEVGNFGP